MTDITPLFPRQPVPDLEVETVGGGRWRLAESKPQNFTMVVFYRGLHCPICSRQLKEIDDFLPDFQKRGVDIIAISADGRERAEKSKADWKLGRLTVGYGLDLVDARRCGLYVSTSRGKTSAGVEEPALFNEPGLFLIRADGTLYFASVQTMPFARPAMPGILSAIDFVLSRDYPARGEVVDLAAAEAAE